MASGGVAEISGLRGDKTRIIDLEGRTAIPGLVDAHFHLAYYGMMSGWLSLADCRSIEDIVGLFENGQGVYRRARGYMDAAGTLPTL